jgi:dGTPase
MDMEDGIKKKWLSVNKVISAIQQHDDISEDVKKRILDCKEAVLNGSTQKKKTWIAVRTALLNHLMAVATQNFVNNLDKIERGDYHKELIEDNDNVYVVLKAFSKDILKQRDIVSLEITGESVIRGLLDAYLKYMFHKDKGYRNRIKRLLSESIFKTVLHEHLQSSTQSTVKADEVDQAYVDFDVKDFSAEERFRLMRDYVACMTDKFALNQYQKLCGNKL